MAGLAGIRRGKQRRNDNDDELDGPTKETPRDTRRVGDRTRRPQASLAGLSRRGR